MNKSDLFIRTGEYRNRQKTVLFLEKILIREGNLFLLLKYSNIE